TKEVNRLVEEEFGVNYSPRSMRRVLRSLKMRYAKPYPRDYRRLESYRATLEMPQTRNINCVLLVQGRIFSADREIIQTALIQNKLCKRMDRKVSTTTVQPVMSSTINIEVFY
ncbi:MAG: winged helix-turn-helix domain-containing protein, partial [Candidatus Bathyarchaeota archaeon]|nr:winged helix-turn-helix domain-containing protein [Candidatus Bathyarchaeota archaeon]